MQCENKSVVFTETATTVLHYLWLLLATVGLVVLCVFFVMTNFQGYRRLQGSDNERVSA